MSAEVEKVAEESSSIKEVSIEERQISPNEITPEVEAKLRRKMDYYIIPWVTIMYLLSFLDRVNIGNARVVNSNEKGVGEFETDLHLTAEQYNWALSVFFIGYVLFEVPSNLLLKKLLPSRWLSRIMVSWGIMASCLAAVNNYASLITVRLLLGIMEAGLFPGVLFYLSFWYRKHELARRMSWFFAAASAAGAFGGVIAYGIAQMGGLGGLKGWQWVFLIEGLPTILFGIATWFVLPDFPSTARFFTQEERDLATARLKLDNIDPDEKEFSWPQFKAAITDIKIWGWMFAYIGVLVPLYSLSFFIPSINRALGFTSLQAQAMSSPPFLAACMASIASGFSSDYFKDRSSHVMTGALVASISFFCLAFVRSPPALYALTIVAAMGTFSMVPAILSWVANNMSGSTKGATAMAMVVGFGNIGGVIAGQVYRSVDAPNYQFGHTFNGCCALWAFIFSLGVRLYLMKENSKRQKAQDAAPGKSVDEVLSEENPAFRFQL